MKVLVLSPGVFDKGGISRYMRFQITALREALGDHKGTEFVSVFSLAGRQEGDLEESFEATWCGEVPWTNGTRARFASAALRHAWKSRPDIVLCGHAYMGPFALTLAKSSRSKLVQNIYGRELWSGISRTRRYALSHADHVIADCHHSADWAFEKGLVAEKPSVVWDCVDTQRYCPGARESEVLRRYGIAATDRFRIMLLGRLNEDTRYKGTVRILQLLSQLPADSFEAVICGHGNDVDFLRSEAVRLGVAGRTTFAGAIHETDMPQVYRSADAFYLVSELGYGMGEGIPLTPLEAMACGVPVVVGNQDGSREIVDGSGGGISVAPDADKAVIQYLQALRANADLLQAERKRARDRAQSVFTYDRFAQKTVAALRGVACDELARA